MALIPVDFQRSRVVIDIDWMDHLTILATSATGGVLMKMVPPWVIIVDWTEVAPVFTEKVL